jgi:hypothetical protein
VSPVLEIDWSPDYAGITAKQMLPQFVTDYHHRRTAGLVFFVTEKPAGNGLDGQSGKELGGHGSPA